MLKKSKNISVNGTSQTEEGEVIGYFSASINDDGTTSTSATISDKELYAQNTAAYKADRAEFVDFIDELADGENT